MSTGNSCMSGKFLRATHYASPSLHLPRRPSPTGASHSVIFTAYFLLWMQCNTCEIVSLGIYYILRALNPRPFLSPFTPGQTFLWRIIRSLSVYFCLFSIWIQKNISICISRFCMMNLCFILNFVHFIYGLLKVHSHLPSFKKTICDNFYLLWNSWNI